MPEQQNVEWKESWRDEFLKWICGFANTDGGSIFIGISDDGKIVGIDNHKRLLEDLPNKISSRLGVLCDIHLRKNDGLFFLEIITKPYNIAISYNGKYYRRSGSTNQELRGADLNEFLLRKSGRTWDDVIEPNATFDDIDPKSVEKFVEDAKRSGRLTSIESPSDVNLIFENLRLVENGKLKRAALLLFGKDPRRFFTSAFVKIGRFGESDSDLLHQDVLEGNLSELGFKVLNTMGLKYFNKKITYENMMRLESSEYPSYALREALFNAMVHRVYESTPIQISVYDDKIIFWNQGELPEQLSVEDLKTKHASFPRNPLIADVYFKAGLIEAWGRGTIQIIEECKKAGLPEPKIEEVNGGVSVTLYKDRTSKEFLSKLDISVSQKKAIDYVKKEGFITSGSYQNLVKVSARTATRHLDELVQLKILKKEGERKHTKYMLP